MKALSRRNTIIIVLAAAASTAASIAGYYAADAQKFYALTNSDLISALRDEHQADQVARHDEELLIQATIEYHKNETQIADFLAKQVSQNAKDYVMFDKQNGTFTLQPKYYDNLYSDYASFDQAGNLYLEKADTSDELSRAFIIITSVLSATVVIFSELSRRKPGQPNME